MATTPAGAQVLWLHHSPPLAYLLHAMWQPSDNLLAESLLDALAPTREGAIARERTWLQSIGIDPATTTIADGSGLSAYDRISARDLVTILAHDWNGPNRALVFGALPVSGQSGTLQKVFTAPPLAGAGDREDRHGQSHSHACRLLADTARNADLRLDDQQLDGRRTARNCGSPRL